MRLLDHVSISVQDLSKFRRFYLATMAALDVVVVHDNDASLGFGERNRRSDDVHCYITVRHSADSSADDARH